MVHVLGVLPFQLFPKTDIRDTCLGSDRIRRGRSRRGNCRFLPRLLGVLRLHRGICRWCRLFLLGPVWVTTVCPLGKLPIWVAIFFHAIFALWTSFLTWSFHDSWGGVDKLQNTHASYRYVSYTKIKTISIFFWITRKIAKKHFLKKKVASKKK